MTLIKSEFIRNVDDREKTRPQPHRWSHASAQVTILPYAQPHVQLNRNMRAKVCHVSVLKHLSSIIKCSIQAHCTRTTTNCSTEYRDFASAAPTSIVNNLNKLNNKYVPAAPQWTSCSFHSREVAGGSLATFLASLVLLDIQYLHWTLTDPLHKSMSIHTPIYKRKCVCHVFTAKPLTERNKTWRRLYRRR